VLELSRIVRFSIPIAALRPDGDAVRVLPADDDPLGGRFNTFAGWPSLPGVGLFCEWEIRCRGEADPRTGYLVGIGEIDVAVRERVIEPLAERLRREPDVPPARVLADFAPALDEHLDGRLDAIIWRLTPFHRVRLEKSRMDRFEIRQQFDFAAAHHLRSPELDDAENRRVFGKCTNAHGHNYRLEVAVTVPMPGPGAAAVLTLPHLEQLVDEHVIERLDHTDLNRQTDAFAGRLPSVENIARVCHELLTGPVDAAGGDLRQVTVWETEKTSCTFPAPAAGVG
jgi:6-pyruvoyltetrahydropterin/6-carboxytetrahydropterin synthase